MFLVDEFEFLWINILCFFSDFFLFLNDTFLSFFKKSCSPPIPKDPITLYIGKQKDRFLTFLASTTPNENIPPLFYCKQEFNETIQDVDNAIEPIWKRRILFESTPRGNILMLYDPFRMGFCYYTDTSTISYSILNSVAMKYVQIYKCADFFMDNEYPFESPLIAAHQEKEEKKKDPEDKKHKEYMRELLADGPFIKRKKTIIEEKKNTSSLEISNPKKEEKSCEFHRNKFVFLGKMRNYDFLKKEVIKKVEQKETMSTQFTGMFRYQDYKKMFHKKNQ